MMLNKSQMDFRNKLTCVFILLIPTWCFSFPAAEHRVSTKNDVDLTNIDVNKLYTETRAAGTLASECKRHAMISHNRDESCDKAKKLLEEIHPELSKLADEIEDKNLGHLNIGDHFRVKKIYINVDQSIADINDATLILNEESA